MFYYKNIANKIHCIAQGTNTITTNSTTYSSIELSNINAKGVKTINDGTNDIEFSISSFPMTTDRFLIYNNAINSYWATNIELNELGEVVSTVEYEGASYTGYNLVYKITDGEPTLVLGTNIEDGLYYAIKMYISGSTEHYVESLIWEKYSTGTSVQTITPTTPFGMYGITKTLDNTFLDYDVKFDLLLQDIFDDMYYKNDSFILDTFTEQLYDGNSTEFTFTTKRNFANIITTSSYSGVEWITRNTFTTTMSQTFHSINPADMTYTLTSDSYIKTIDTDTYYSVDSFIFDIAYGADTLAYKDSLGFILTRNNEIEYSTTTIENISQEFTNTGEYSFYAVNLDRQGNVKNYINDSDIYILSVPNPNTPSAYGYPDWATIFTMTVVGSIQYDFRILNNFIYASILNSSSYPSHRISIERNGVELASTIKQNLILSPIQTTYRSNTYSDSDIIPSIEDIEDYIDLYRCVWLDSGFDSIDNFDLVFKVEIGNEYQEIIRSTINLQTTESDIGSLLTYDTTKDVPICPLNCTLKSDIIGDDNVILLDEDIVSLYDFNGIINEDKTINKINSIDKCTIDGHIYGKNLYHWIENEFTNIPATVAVPRKAINTITVEEGTYSLNVPYENTGDSTTYSEILIEIENGTITIGTETFTAETVNVISVTSNTIYVNDSSFAIIAIMPTDLTISIVGKLIELRQYNSCDIAYIHSKLNQYNGIKYIDESFYYTLTDSKYTFTNEHSKLYASVGELNSNLELEELTDPYVYFTYGKLEKISLLRKYNLYTRQADKRYIFQNENSTYSHLNGLHKSQNNYINNGTFYNSKNYDYKLFMQQGTINHITIPLTIKNIGSVDYLIYDKSNISPEYVGLIYLNESYDGDLDKYYELLNTQSIYSKSLPSTTTQLCVWGKEFLEIEDTDIEVYSTKIENRIDSPYVDAYTLIENMSICWDKTAFIIKPFKINRYMVESTHIPFEYIRSVVDISDLVVNGQFENKLISSEGDLFSHANSNCTVEIADDLANWNKFNINRLYKPKNNDRLFLFEGNIENYFLSNVSVINEVIVELDRIVLNSSDVLSSLKDIKCTITGNIEDFHRYYYFNNINKLNLKVYTNETFGDVINQINNIGLRTTMSLNDELTIIPIADKILDDFIDYTDNDILENISITSREIINRLDIQHINRLPVTQHLEPIQIQLNHTLMGTATSFNPIVLYTSFDSFNKLMLNAGDRCVMWCDDYPDYEFNCKIVDMAIDPYFPTKVKITISAGYDKRNYYGGYYDELWAIFGTERTFRLNLDTEYDNVVYQLQIGEKYTNLGQPILPQEEFTVIGTLSSPESDLFSYSGYIKNQNNYYGTFTLPKKQFVYDVETSAIVVDDNFENTTIREIQDVDCGFYGVYDGDLEFTVEKDEDMKFIFKNPATEQKGFHITPLKVVGAIMYLSTEDFDKVSVGNVLKLNPIYEDINNDLYGTYITNKEYKYKITGKLVEGIDRYITLSRAYPTEKNRNGKYCSPLVYTSYVKLDHFELRANSIIDVAESYVLKDIGSIEYYGEKTLSINNSILNWTDMKKNIIYIYNHFSGGADGNEYTDKLGLNIKFSLHKDVLLNVGDLVRVYSEILGSSYIFMITEKKITLDSFDEFAGIMMNDYGKYESVELKNTAKTYFTEGYEYVLATDLRTLGDTTGYVENMILDATYNSSTQRTVFTGDWSFVDTSLSYLAIEENQYEISLQYDGELYTNTILNGQVGLYSKSTPLTAYIPNIQDVTYPLYMSFETIPKYIKVIVNDVEIYSTVPATQVFTLNYGQIPIEVELADTYIIKTDTYMIYVYHSENKVVAKAKAK